MKQTILGTLQKGNVTQRTKINRTTYGVTGSISSIKVSTFKFNDVKWKLIQFLTTKETNNDVTMKSRM